MRWTCHKINFREIYEVNSVLCMLWDGFWGYFGTQNITTNLCFCPGRLAWYQDSDSLHVCTHGYKWPSAVSSLVRTTWRSNSRKPLEFCLVFSLIIIQARMCGHCAQNLLVLMSPQLFVTSRPWRLCGHGSVQTIRRLLTWKPRVGNAISVKTLGRRSLGLPD